MSTPNDPPQGPYWQQPQDPTQGPYWQQPQYPPQRPQYPPRQPPGYPPPGYAPPPYQQPPQPPRRKRHTARNVLLSIGGLIVLIIIIVAAASGGGKKSPAAAGGAASSPQASAPPSAAAKTGAKATRQTITYVVTGSNAQVTYGPTGSGLNGHVPMHVTRKLRNPEYYSISAQLQGGGAVTCKILVDGKVLSTAKATGSYNIAQCEIVQDPVSGNWQSANG